MVKNSPAGAGDKRDKGLISERGRSSGGGSGNFYPEISFYTSYVYKVMQSTYIKFII